MSDRRKRGRIGRRTGRTLEDRVLYAHEIMASIPEAARLYRFLGVKL